MGRPRIIVGDGRPLERGVVRYFLEENGLDVVSEASRPEDIVRLATEHRPDAIVMHEDVLGGESARVFEGVRAANPSTRLVVISPAPLISAPTLHRLGADAVLEEAVGLKDLSALLFRLCAAPVAVAGVAAAVAASAGGPTEAAAEVVPLPPPRGDRRSRWLGRVQGAAAAIVLTLAVVLAWQQRPLDVPPAAEPAAVQLRAAYDSLDSLVQTVLSGSPDAIATSARQLIEARAAALAAGADVSALDALIAAKLTPLLPTASPEALDVLSTILGRLVPPVSPGPPTSPPPPGEPAHSGPPSPEPQPAVGPTESPSPSPTESPSPSPSPCLEAPPAQPDPTPGEGADPDGLPNQGCWGLPQGPSNWLTETRPRLGRPGLGPQFGDAPGRSEDRRDSRSTPEPGGGPAGTRHGEKHGDGSRDNAPNGHTNHHGDGGGRPGSDTNPVDPVPNPGTGNDADHGSHGNGDDGGASHGSGDKGDGDATGDHGNGNGEKHGNGDKDSDHGNGNPDPGNDHGNGNDPGNGNGNPDPGNGNGNPDPGNGNGNPDPGNGNGPHGRVASTLGVLVVLPRVLMIRRRVKRPRARR